MLKRSLLHKLGRLSLLVWLMLVGGMELPAQDSLPSQRQAFVDALNAALEEAGTTHSTMPVALKHDDVGDILLKGFGGGCDTLLDSGALEIRYDGAGMFTLRLLLRPVDTMYVPGNSHQLACDLNEIWLRRPWYIRLIDSVGSIKLASACVGAANKNYFMDTIDVAAPGVNDSMVARYNVGYLYLEGVPYTIPDISGNEVSQPVGSLFTIPRHYWSYIGRYAAVAASHIDTGRLAHYSIEFHNPYPINVSNPYPDRSDLTVLTKVEIIFQTQRYPQDCSLPVMPSGEPGSNVGGAKFTLKYTVDDGLGNSTVKSCERVFTGGTVNQNNDELWDFYQPWNDFNIRNLGQFDVDSLGYLTFKVNNAVLCTDTITYRIMRVRYPITPAEYCETSFSLDGAFVLDSMSGEIMFKPSGASAQPVPCLGYCHKISGYQTVDGVIAATAQSFSDRWEYPTNEYLTPSAQSTWPTQNLSNNEYEIGVRGKWRPNATFVYRTDIKKGAGTAVNAAERNYKNAGVFVDNTGSSANGFVIYNWANQAANDSDHWIMADSVTRFSPHGQPVEERDVLGIYSSAKFVHGNTVPRLVAKNARYGTVEFESFEEARGNTYGIAHSGKYSYRLPVSHGWDTLGVAVTLDDHLIAKKLQVRLWAKRTYRDVGTGELPVQLDDGAGSSMEAIAQTGEWTLYERIVDLSTGTAGQTHTLHFKNALTDPGGGGIPDTVWIDDVRLQPLDAQMMCYVYDRNILRPVAQFDDQHFGLYYQYNGEGKLVRKLVETERGMKTVTETQYHTPDLIYRDGTTALSAASGGGSGSGPAAAARRRGDAQEDEEGGNGLRSKGDILNIELGPDGRKIEVLGSENPRLPRLEDFTLPDLDSLAIDPGSVIDTAALRLPEYQGSRLRALLGDQRLQSLLEVREIDRVLRLMEAHRDSIPEEERKQVIEQMAKLSAKRKELIERHLGLSEEEIRAMYREIDALALPRKETER